MQTYFFDTHQDIADSILYAAHGDFWKKNGLHEGWNDLGLPVNNQSDYVRLQEGNVKAIFGVSCAIGVDEDGHIVPCPTHLHDTLEQINLYHRLVREGNGKVQLIRTVNDLENVSQYNLSFLLTIEGADSIDDELVYLDTYFNMGVRCIGLTWSYNNELAGGCSEDGELTDRGENTIRRMEELGMLLDLSHINEKSGYQALEVSSQPVIVSHTASKSVYDHERNMDDAQMKAIVATGGAVGICGVPKFIGEEGSVGIEDVVAHTKYIADLVGVDHVIIGSDFGAMTANTLMEDFADVTHLPDFAEALLSAGFVESDIKKIAYENIERILKEVLPQ